MKKLFTIGIVLTFIPLIPSVTTYKATEFSFTVIKAQVSAYTSSVDETDDTPFITASGTATKLGVVACPVAIPFGTQVVIEGKSYTCEDRMNPRYQNKPVFDVWMSSKKQAFEWGRQTVQVVIYKDKTKV